MSVRVRDRATGDVVHVDPAEAQKAVLAGKAELVDRTVRVIGPEGTGTVDAADLTHAYNHGWNLADEAQVKTAQRQREANTAAGQARGALEAFSRGQWAGLTDVADRALGEDMEAVRARRESLGAAGTALELAPQVGAAVLSGGLTAGARGLAAVGLEAAEGAVVGAGQSMSEAALWDRDVTAEDVAHGALLGAAIGGGAAGAGQGLGKLLRSGKRASGKAWQDVANAVDPTDAPVSREIGQALRKRDILADPTLRRAAIDPGAVRQEIVSDLTAQHRKASKLLSETSDLVEQAPGRLRKVDTRDLYLRGDPERAGRELLVTQDAVARKLLDLSTANPAAKKPLRELVSELDASVSSKGIGEQYAALDEFGGKIERVARKLDASGDVPKREAARALRSVSSVVDKTLDNAEVFGSMIDSRQTIRQAIDGIGAAESTLPAGLKGGNLDGSELLGLARKGEVDEGLGARLRALETMAEQRQLPKSTLAKLDEAKREIGALRDQLQKHGRQAEAVELVERLGKTEMDLEAARDVAGVVGVGRIVGAMADASGAGGLGSLMVAGAQMLTRPRSMLANAARAVDFVSAISKGRSDALDVFANRMAGKAPRKNAAVKIPATRLTRAAAIKLAEDVERTDPTALYDRTQGETQRLAEFAPRTAAQAQATTAVAVDFLKSKAPAAYTNPWTKRKLVDPVAADRFARYAEAVLHPLTVWERLADGTLTREHVEAIRTVYPHTYRQVQTSVLDRLSRMSEPAPYESRITLGLLLDLQTDPSLKPRHQQAIAAAFGPPVPEPSAPGQGQLNAAAAHQISGRADALSTPYADLESKDEYT